MRVWGIERRSYSINNGCTKFLDCLLLGSWTEKKFRKQVRVKCIIFWLICQRLGPYLKKDDTCFKDIVLMQEKVVMSLYRLDIGGGLQSIGDLYEMYKGTLSEIIREFCRIVRKHLQPIFVQTPNESKFRILASRLSSCITYLTS